MGKKSCGCEEQTYHVHPYCIYTNEKDCHRHLMRAFTAPAPDTPCHKHEYEGTTSCNDGHNHKYHGCTEKPIKVTCGHIHNFCGKTSCEMDHKHRYEGITGRPRMVFGKK